MDDSDATPGPARTIGEVIRRRRAHLHLSQGALAQALGTRQSTVSSWELGDNGVGIETLYKIAGPLKWGQADIDAAIEMMKAEAAAKAGTDPAQAAS